MCSTTTRPRSPRCVAVDTSTIDSSFSSSSRPVSVPSALQIALAARQSNKTRERKTVSFHPQVQICPVENIDDYTDEEYISCWYLESEHEEMRQQVKDTVIRMRCGDFDDAIGVDCTRGLERHGTKGGNTKIKQMRKRVIKAVLIEQEINKSSHDIQEKIATASLRASISSRSMAALLAAEDAAFVHVMSAVSAEAKDLSATTSSCYNIITKDAVMAGIDPFSSVTVEGPVQMPSSLTNLHVAACVRR
mmetsp:Transcript_8257/g.16796  ORF Transcript_8257/g.16796 Transcript_8257/m.16796 type:complete len:248 (-) Transcript_8257:2024-2767(-)